MENTHKLFFPLTFQSAHDKMQPHYQILSSLSHTSFPISSKETIQICPKKFPLSYEVALQEFLPWKDILKPKNLHLLQTNHNRPPILQIKLVTTLGRATHKPSSLNNTYTIGQTDFRWFYRVFMDLSRIEAYQHSQKTVFGST